MSLQDSAVPNEDIRWQKFFNLLTGQLIESDGLLTHAIVSAVEGDADVYGTYKVNQLLEHRNSFIRVLVAGIGYLLSVKIA